MREHRSTKRACGNTTASARRTRRRNPRTSPSRQPSTYAPSPCATHGCTVWISRRPCAASTSRNAPSTGARSASSSEKLQTATSNGAPSTRARSATIAYAIASNVPPPRLRADAINASLASMPTTRHPCVESARASQPSPQPTSSTLGGRDAAPRRRSQRRCRRDGSRCAVRAPRRSTPPRCVASSAACARPDRSPRRERHDSSTLLPLADRKAHAIIAAAREDLARQRRLIACCRNRDIRSSSHPARSRPEVRRCETRRAPRPSRAPRDPIGQLGDRHVPAELALEQRGRVGRLRPAARAILRARRDAHRRSSTHVLPVTGACTLKRNASPS